MDSLALFGAATACYFMYVAWREPRPAVFVAVILWLLYAAFEMAAARGALADGTSCDPTALCNLGIDLFLWPILLIASLFASYAPGQWTATGKRLGVIGLSILAFFSTILLIIWLEERWRGLAKQSPSQSEALGKGK